MTVGVFTPVTTELEWGICEPFMKTEGVVGCSTGPIIINGYQLNSLYIIKNLENLNLNLKGF